MSSRALRRLEKNKLAELEFKPPPVEKTENEEGEVEEDADDEASEQDSVQKRFNAFSLLNEGSDNEESEEEEEEFEPEQKKKTAPQIKQVVTKSKKAKKKKKSKQKKEIEPEIDSDEELDRILAETKRKDQEKLRGSSNSPYYGDEDEYDFEEEYDDHDSPVPNYEDNFKYFTTRRLKQSLPLLSVKSIGNLDQDQEYRNLFGNLSMDTIEDANSTTSLAISPEMLQQFKKLARLTRGWGGNDRRSVPGTTRKLLLSKIRDDYLPTTLKPMTMEEIKPEDYREYLECKNDTLDLKDLELKIKKEQSLGVRYFKFNKINSVKEQIANTKFYVYVVLRPDHEGLMKLLQEYPYHVETLLQVAMVLLRQGDNKSASSALVERALFAFDRSFHKNCHELLSQAKTGLIRLPYEKFMNRQFYLCLFRYIIALGERSTFFTALSYCKFLLSLFPSEDPLGVRYFIDYYAIMSEEYKYLIQFAESPLTTTYTKWYTPGIAYSTVLAHLRLGDKEKAKIALKQAFEAHPYTAFKLFETVGLAKDISIKESEFTINREVMVSTETYLVRAGALWNKHDEVQFLHDELKELFSSRKQQKPGRLEGVKASIYEFLGLSTAEEKMDGEIPVNLLRFTVLSGESRIMAKLPEHFWSREDIHEYDVLPPNPLPIMFEGGRILEDAHDNKTVTDLLFYYLNQELLSSILLSGSEEPGFDEAAMRRIEAAFRDIDIDRVQLDDDPQRLVDMLNELEE
ncbi:uncharacterized protein J8A68_003606 [[Candida] subhashii]|uniref:DUF654-domain-containing protein n=1 Tax=[Candida] subhashii TaxID=561895 RepID=A0A8J5ULI4_9ASCO|nr:uncharacterized protein J8A68_003606 [[Candida] subhashii]KAG7662836.1 hypothetical protein J8A68_003606 [[Candida] subhashii]